MGELVQIDGRIRKPEDAKVSVFDRGFLYGDSVFETIRTYGGEPYALFEHLDRLQKSAALVGITMPVGRSELSSEIREALAAAGNVESYVRVMITRGTGQLGLDPGSAKNPLRVVIVAPLTPPPASLYESGIAAITYRTQRPSDATDAVGAKIGNYLVAALAMQAARAQGAAEALIVDGRGRVVEGATSNVFFVENGRVITPATDEGILAGITRARLLEVCRDLGVPVGFEAVAVERLSELDEIFISSSIREILAVVRVDGAAVGGGEPGPITRRLHSEFRARVQRDLDQSRA